MTKKYVEKLSIEDKKRKLILMLNSVLDNSFYKYEINEILSKFSMTRDIVERSFLDYNLDVHSHDNSIYEQHPIRVVLHVHNLIEGSWHIERQEAICQMIAEASPKKAIDLGFGVPSRYVRELLKTKSFQLTLCDYQQPALDFAQQLLQTWSVNWQQNIKLYQANLEDVNQCVGDYDLYISLHSIEHVAKPAQCLHDYIRLSVENAKFLIEIPIGPITPEHTIAWANIWEAQEWISELGLEIINDRMTFVNPAVDIFAEPHDFNYGGYLMLCRKK